jgi:flagellar basal-body rod protein FlgC
MSASAFDVAASGMAAHRAEMDVIAANLANANTVGPNGASAYRARTAVFEPAQGSAFASALDDATFDFDSDTSEASDDSGAPAGVRFAGVVEDEGPGQFRYDPSSPLSILSGPRRGFVAVPDVDPIEQMVALVSAGRAYDADVAALQAAKQMDVEAVDVDRS